MGQPDSAAAARMTLLAALRARDLRVEYLTAAQAHGPIAIYARAKSGVWYVVGQEVAVGHWEHD